MSQDLGGGLLMRVESCALVIAAGVHICMHLSPSQTSSPPTSGSGGAGESDEGTSARVRTWGLESFAFGFSVTLTVVSTVSRRSGYDAELRSSLPPMCRPGFDFTSYPSLPSFVVDVAWTLLTPF